MGVSLLPYPSPRATWLPCRLPVPGRLGVAALVAGGLAALPTSFPRGRGAGLGGRRGTARDVCAEAEAVSPEAPRLFPRLLRDTR